MILVILLLIVIAGGVAYLIFRSNRATRPAENKPKKPYSESELRIENVRPGGVIHLTSIGPDLEDFDVHIVSKHTYHEGEYTWYELEGDRGDGTVWIDMEEDDGLDLSIVLRKLKLRELGLSNSDLERFDDQEKGHFTFENETYFYEDSDRAVFYRHSDDRSAEKFYYWDFENENGDKFISAEKWSDGSIDVSVSVPIKISQVTVYSLGEPT